MCVLMYVCIYAWGFTSYLTIFQPYKYDYSVSRFVSILLILSSRGRASPCCQSIVPNEVSCRIHMAWYSVHYTVTWLNPPDSLLKQFWGHWAPSEVITSIVFEVGRKVSKGFKWQKKVNENAQCLLQKHYHQALINSRVVNQFNKSSYTDLYLKHPHGWSVRTASGQSTGILLW